jgi:hypothetical protein
MNTTGFRFVSESVPSRCDILILAKKEEEEEEKSHLPPSFLSLLWQQHSRSD